MNNLKVWLHGLLAAAISAFATAASGAITLPTVFNFSKDGMLNVVKLATIPALLAVFAYLKTSPVPSETATITATVTKTEN
jgi:acyl-coenzyme A synthetase/AMP-(fatty) acid ligase